MQRGTKYGVYDAELNRLLCVQHHGKWREAGPFSDVALHVLWPLIVCQAFGSWMQILSSCAINDDFAGPELRLDVICAVLIENEFGKW